MEEEGRHCLVISAPPFPIHDLLQSDLHINSTGMTLVTLASLATPINVRGQFWIELSMSTHPCHSSQSVYLGQSGHFA